MLKRTLRTAVLGLAFTTSSALFSGDKHSVDQIVGAIQSPLSPDEQKRAQEADDIFSPQGSTARGKGIW